jgi:hypothetical protein
VKQSLFRQTENLRQQNKACLDRLKIAVTKQSPFRQTENLRQQNKARLDRLKIAATKQSLLKFSM